MIRNGIYRYWLAFFVTIVTMVADAESYTSTPSEGLSLGGVASNILSVEKSARSFIGFICVVAGAGLCIASIGLFFSHWKNPGNVRLSKPVSMVFLGLALIGLSFIPMLT